MKRDPLIIRVANCIAKASWNNPVLSLIIVTMYYMAFNHLESMVEELIFGERFIHFGDPFFAMIFMAFGGLTVWCCCVNRQL